MQRGPKESGSRRFQVGPQHRSEASHTRNFLKKKTEAKEKASCIFEVRGVAGASLAAAGDRGRWAATHGSTGWASFPGAAHHPPKPARQAARGRAARTCTQHWENTKFGSPGVDAKLPGPRGREGSPHLWLLPKLYLKHQAAWMNFPKLSYHRGSLPPQLTPFWPLSWLFSSIFNSSLGLSLGRAPCIPDSILSHFLIRLLHLHHQAVAIFMDSFPMTRSSPLPSQPPPNRVDLDLGLSPPSTLTTLCPELSCVYVQCTLTSCLVFSS